MRRPRRPDGEAELVRRLRRLPRVEPPSDLLPHILRAVGREPLPPSTSDRGWAWCCLAALVAYCLAGATALLPAWQTGVLPALLQRWPVAAATTGGEMLDALRFLPATLSPSWLGAPIALLLSTTELAAAFGLWRLLHPDPKQGGDRL